jgi:outer membrane protein
MRTNNSCSKLKELMPAMAKENLEISMQRLRLGQTTSLELHQAQESYVGAQTRLVNFEYNLKVAETKLKQLLSEL